MHIQFSSLYLVLLSLTSSDLVRNNVIAFSSPSELPKRFASSFSAIPSKQSITNDIIKKEMEKKMKKEDDNNSITLRSSNNESNQQQEWIEKSMEYYSKVMRVERRRNSGQIPIEILESEEYQDEIQNLALKHYFAIRKVKDGQYRHAEVLYRKIINQLINEGEQDDDDHHCDHSKLAISTLLLALHLQRMGEYKKTRTAFINFFRIVVVESEQNNNTECACSAKVLGAYALFEYKRGNRIKGFQIAQKAVQFDPLMKPILQWKQFRDVADEIVIRQQQQEEELRP